MSNFKINKTTKFDSISIDKINLNSNSLVVGNASAGTFSHCNVFGGVSGTTPVVNDTFVIGNAGPAAAVVPATVPIYLPHAMTIGGTEGIDPVSNYLPIRVGNIEYYIPLHVPVLS